jgi:hypothetical protein
MEKVSSGFSENQVVMCFCNKCSKKINHYILKSIRIDWSDSSDGYPTEAHNDFQIIQCVGCNTHSFRIDEYFSELAEYFPDGSGSDGTSEKLYPESTQYSHALKAFEHLPYNLKNVYEEAVTSFNHHQYILCSVGIRSILDGICIERKIEKGMIEYIGKDGVAKKEYSNKLDGKINGLKEFEIITRSQMQALHELRFLGNKAIHELEIPARSDLETAFEIIEHILMDIYELPAKSDKLKNNRKKT